MGIIITFFFFFFFFFVALFCFIWLLRLAFFPVRLHGEKHASSLTTAVCVEVLNICWEKRMDPSFSPFFVFVVHIYKVLELERVCSYHSRWYQIILEGNGNQFMFLCWWVIYGLLLKRRVWLGAVGNILRGTAQVGQCFNLNSRTCLLSSHPFKT